MEKSKIWLLALSCNVAMKLPFFVVSSEKSTLLSPLCPLNGKPCLAKFFTQLTMWPYFQLPAPSWHYRGTSLP